MGHDAAALESTAKTFRADMWHTVCEEVALECGIEQRCFGPVQVTVFESLPDAPLVNTVLGAAEPGAVEGRHLARAIKWADSFDVDYRVQVARDRPEMASAEAWLNWHGFEQGRGLVKFVRDGSMPDVPGVPGIKVWEIHDEDAAGETMVFSAGPAVGMPSRATILLCALPTQERWRIYTAELEGEIVSFGSMLIQDKVAVLGLDGTLEEARRRGCNQALLRERLVAANEAGCETVFAEIGEWGEEEGNAIATRNLMRAGFVLAHRSMNWQRPRPWAPAY